MKKIHFLGSKNIISNRLRQYRAKQGLSQEQLANKMQTMGANMDQQMISRIESNDRFVTDYELACICHILGVTADDMLQDFPTP